MRWYIINIGVPVFLPLLCLWAMKLFHLPSPALARTSLLRAVRDGQLGWAAVGFAASCTYDVVSYVAPAGKTIPSWTGDISIFAAGVALISSLLATIGTVFPFDESLPVPTTLKEWIVHYRLFVGSATMAVAAGLLYGSAHYLLS